VQAQLAESLTYAAAQGVAFKVWTEGDSGLSDDHAIIEWAKAWLLEFSGDTAYAERQKEIRRRIRARQYQKISADKVEVWCDFCNELHTPLRLTYTKNLARNGRYVCERYGGHLAGKKPKAHLRQSNPYAADGSKKCSQCGEVRSLAQFTARKASWDGLNAACRKCVSRQNADRYLNRKA
jgi:hypothetical protein